MTNPTSQQKTAKIVDARAITVVCETCDTHCTDEDGSTVITEDSQTVMCPDCGSVYAVPRQAFRVVYKAKLKEVA